MKPPAGQQPALALDGALLLDQLRRLGDIGVDADAGGRTRIALTDDERAGRDLVVEWMRELDLDIQVDRIGNIFGTLRSAADDGSERPLMMGSHIDTVKNAGALDGCYGVLAGLAVARAFREAGIKPRRSITVGAFTNEEGIRYQPDMMGSLVHAGGMSVDAALERLCDLALVWGTPSAWRATTVVAELLGVPAGPSPEAVPGLLAEVDDRARAIRYSTLSAICRALDCEIGELLVRTD